MRSKTSMRFFVRMVLSLLSMSHFVVDTAALASNYVLVIFMLAFGVVVILIVIVTSNISDDKFDR